MKEKVDAGYSRLHITPFNPQLLKVIVPPGILPNARRISYHSIQTFPDKLYGYVDLPIADATKIKSKLNGATLRGAKINIETARFETMPTPISDAIATVDRATMVKKPKLDKKDKKDKKRKRNNLEISGVELEDGRKVKRGWTVTSEDAQAKKKKARIEDRKQGKPTTKDDEKKQKKRRRQDTESQYIDGPEALVKTRLPPNKVDISKSGTTGDKKKPKKSNNKEVTVHEFANNTKFATFLKAAQPTPATGREGASFEKGKGWVNESGTVVEEVKSTRPTTIPKLQVKTLTARPRVTESEDTSSSGGTSSEEDDSDADSSQASPVMQQSKSKADPNVASPNAALAGSIHESDSARPKSSGSMRSLTIQIPPATPTPASSKLHPLEALYKRVPGGEDQAATHTPIDSQPFTFGGGLDDDLDDEENQDADHTEQEPSQGRFQGSQLPMTPYSKQDFEWRNTRSAAPTPDTAHPSRISRFWPMGGDDDLEDVLEDDKEDVENDFAGGQGAVGAGAGVDAIDPNTDFQKWFWKNRGNLDRSWRKRRREAAKAKRYRENKAKEDRAV